MIGVARTSLRRNSAHPWTSSSSSNSWLFSARSQWERYTLADGMELHIRRPLSRIEQRQFEKLMAAARNIFDESEGEGQA